VEPYALRYTQLARAFLADRVKVFEERFRDELVHELGEEGEVADLILHSIEFDDRVLVGAWCDEGWIVIDTATEEEKEIASGPHKGQKIIIPRPETA
jgi:hypothetical protein